MDDGSEHASAGGRTIQLQGHAGSCDDGFGPRACSPELSDEDYDDGAQGTHYSLSTVTEEDSQVEVTGTESGRGLSPYAEGSVCEQSADQSLPSADAARPHLRLTIVTPQPSSQTGGNIVSMPPSLTSAPGTEGPVTRTNTIEADDLLFADEASQWACHERADESETSARLESSALPDESESTELRDLVADMTEADVEGLVAELTRPEEAQRVWTVWNSLRCDTGISTISKPFSPADPQPLDPENLLQAEAAGTDHETASSFLSAALSSEGAVKQESHAIEGESLESSGASLPPPVSFAVPVTQEEQPSTSRTPSINDVRRALGINIGGPESGTERLELSPPRVRHARGPAESMLREDKDHQPHEVAGSPASDSKIMFNIESPSVSALDRLPELPQQASEGVMLPPTVVHDISGRKPHKETEEERRQGEPEDREFEQAHEMSNISATPSSINSERSNFLPVEFGLVPKDELNLGSAEPGRRISIDEVGIHEGEPFIAMASHGHDSVCAGSGRSDETEYRRPFRSANSEDQATKLNCLVAGTGKNKHGEEAAVILQHEKYDQTLEVVENTPPTSSSVCISVLAREGHELVNNLEGAGAAPALGIMQRSGTPISVRLRESFENEGPINYQPVPEDDSLAHISHFVPVQRDEKESRPTQQEHAIEVDKKDASSISCPVDDGRSTLVVTGLEHHGHPAVHVDQRKFQSCTAQHSELDSPRSGIESQEMKKETDTETVQLARVGDSLCGDGNDYRNTCLDEASGRGPLADPSNLLFQAGTMISDVHGHDLYDVLSPHIEKLAVTCSEIFHQVHLASDAASEHGLMISAGLARAEEHAQVVEDSIHQLLTSFRSQIRDLESKIAARDRQILMMSEEINIVRAGIATTQLSYVSEDPANIQGSDGTTTPIGSSTPHGSNSELNNLSRVSDSSYREMQQLESKYQNFKNTTQQQEATIKSLERNLASCQNLARQREEEINRLQDRMCESESDHRRKIEKLTTYTHNLCKDVEEKELERDQKKADILRLQELLDERDLLITQARSETKDERIKSRNQLLILEDERKKVVDMHTAAHEQLTLLQLDTTKKINELEAALLQKEADIAELGKSNELQKIQLDALHAAQGDIQASQSQVESQLTIFANKAIEADKRASKMEVKLSQADNRMQEANKKIKALKATKINFESQLREKIDSEAVLQQHLNKTLYEIDDLKENVSSLQKDLRDNNTLLTRATQQTAVLEATNIRMRDNSDRVIEEKNTKITSLQSKISVGELREEHLIRQMQEIIQMRDITSQKLQQSQDALIGAQECAAMLRQEKDALERILKSKKIIEKGNHNRNLHFEKVLSATSGQGVLGLQYRAVNENAIAKDLQEDSFSNGDLSEDRERTGEMFVPHPPPPRAIKQAWGADMRQKTRPSGKERVRDGPEAGNKVLKLHPVSLSHVKQGCKSGQTRVDSKQATMGTRRSLAQMLDDDVQYLQRLVCGDHLLPSASK